MAPFGISGSSQLIMMVCGLCGLALTFLGADPGAVRHKILAIVKQEIDRNW